MSLHVPPRLARSLYWAEQHVRGRGDVRTRLAWLRQTQLWSRQRLLELQADKLALLVAHAYATVPYYRQMMDERGVRPEDIGSPADLHLLPLLTRADLRSHQAEMLSTLAGRDGLQTNFSSGSTGMRAQFVQDADFRLWMRAHQLRTYEWCGGWQLGEPFMLFWGSEIYWSKKRRVDQFENALTNRREASTFRLSPDAIRRFADDVLSFRPTLISTYANAIHLLARAMDERGQRSENLRAVQGTSEPLPAEMRRRITDVFGCEVYDKYGMRETNIVSHESPGHAGNCIQVENVVVEILDEDHCPCPPGVTGRVVVTPLNNLAMPLLRYETSDLASFVSGTCRSGVELPLMSEVAGRLQDLIHSPNGDAIDAYFFSYLLMRFPQIHWFQVVQREFDRLTLRIYVPNGLAVETVREIEERIVHHTGFAFQLDIETLDTMPESSTGKFRLCVSELQAPSAHDVA